MANSDGKNFLQKINITLRVLLIIVITSVLTGCSQNDRKYNQGTGIAIAVKGTNASSIKKYEKFEINIDLKNAEIKNPYDPADIDIYAIFKSPSGEEIKINGFFDNYRDTGKWKIRFSPKETGQYEFTIFVNDGSESAASQSDTFTAVESEHHGWIKPSEKNPHYFTHDDGTTYYAIGVYSPWGNSQERFQTYADHDANLLAIWDITYGGFVNSNGLIENELGRYNQEKLGMIDSMLTILEKDDIKLMFAIWPHDLFSKTVWAAQWDQNPYSKVIEVEDVYSDSIVWEYQKMKYRYMIARFAHSRSWGIWELINEMNGTDGWAKGRHQEAYDWVRKCVQYFSENDPYSHPVTASFSGGFEEYREPLYKLTDIPNLHMYPAQGWKLEYPGDTMRSDMYNYAWASRRFWDNFEKPAIFGEAGADLTYYKPQSSEYHISYHNQIWASLVNGLAGIPVWWDFPVLNKQDWQQLQHLASFVKDIDFANLPYKPAEAFAEGSDIYVMDSGEKAFGWSRRYSDFDAGMTLISVSTSLNGNCTIEWFDSWSGSILKTERVTAKNGRLEAVVPRLIEKHPDIAFKISKTI